MYWLTTNPEFALLCSPGTVRTGSLQATAPRLWNLHGDVEGKAIKNTCVPGSTSGHGHLDVFCSVAVAMIPVVSVMTVYTPSVVAVAAAFGRARRAPARQRELVVPSPSVGEYGWWVPTCWGQRLPHLYALSHPLLFSGPFSTLSTANYPLVTAAIVPWAHNSFTDPGNVLIIIF